MTDQEKVELKGLPHSPTRGRNNTSQRLFVGGSNDMSSFLLIPDAPVVVETPVVAKVEVVSPTEEVPMEEKVLMDGGRNKKMVTGCDGDCFDLKIEDVKPVEKVKVEEGPDPVRGSKFFAKPVQADV